MFKHNEDKPEIVKEIIPKRKRKKIKIKKGDSEICHNKIEFFKNFEKKL
jgi:hypothetical protein